MREPAWSSRRRSSVDTFASGNSGAFENTSAGFTDHGDTDANNDNDDGEDGRLSSAFGASSNLPRRLRRYEMGPHAVLLEEVLEGDRTILALLSRGENPQPARNRFESLVPSLDWRDMRFQSARELEFAEATSRRSIESVRAAGMTRLENDLLGLIRTTLDEAAVFCDTLQLTLRRSFEDDEERTRARILRMERREGLRARQRTAVRALAQEEAAARLTVLHERSKYEEAVRLQRRHMTHRRETEADLDRQDALLRARVALEIDVAKVAEDRRYWSSVASDAEWQSRIFLSGYELVLQDDALEAEWRATGARLAVEGVESARRLEIEAAFDAAFAAASAMVDDAHEREAAARRSYHSLGSTTLTWAGYQAQLALTTSNEPEVRSLIHAAQRGEFFNLLQIEEASLRQVIQEASQATSVGLFQGFAEELHILRAGDLAETERIDRDAITAVATCEAQEVAKNMAAVIVNHLVDILEPTGRSGIARNGEATLAAVRATGRLSLLEIAARASIAADEDTARHMIRCQHRARRMELIADEADDGLDKKVLWRVADVEADDRRIYGRMEQRERLAREPEWICLHGYLRERSLIESEATRLFEQMAVRLNESRLRAEIVEEQRIVQVRFYDRIAGAFDVGHAIAVTSNPLVPIGMAAVWLSIMATE